MKAIIIRKAASISTSDTRMATTRPPSFSSLHTVGYAVLLHLQKLLGVHVYVTRECKRFLSTTFDPATITIPVLEDTFCDYYRGIGFEPYYGSFRELVENKDYHKGRVM